MRMPPSRFVCEFYTDAPSFHLAEDFAPSKPGQVLRVSSQHLACDGVSVALRQYHVLGLVYRRQPLLQKIAAAGGDAPVAERTPFDHAVVRVSSAHIAADACSVHALMSAPGEILELRGWGKPIPTHWIDAIFTLELPHYGVVKDQAVIQQCPLFAFALCLCNLPGGDDFGEALPM